MKKHLLYLLPIGGLIGLSFLYRSQNISQYHVDGIETVNFSSNPPGGQTGAPGESNCTSCHTGSTMSGEGVIFFTLSGGPNYTPGVTYPITVSTVGGPRNGFEITILDGSNNQAGTFSAGANSSVVSFGGRQYARHSSSTGETSWTFDWTAPAADAGELTAYYSLNKANHNGSTSGDEIFLGSTAIPAMAASVEENELENGYSAFYNNINQVLNVSYLITEKSKVVLNIQDLSGRLVDYYDLGYQMPGSYKEVLPVTKVNQSGVYIISLFIGNRVLNRKVML